MASKAVAFVARSLLFLAAIQACEPNCSHPAPATTVGRPTPHGNHCPIDILQLKLCADVLNLDMLKVQVGRVPPTEHCCSLIAGLVDLEAAACVCAAVRANVLDLVGLDVQVGVSLLLNRCGKTCRPDFTCSR